MFYCPTPQISQDFQPRGRFYYFSSVVTFSPLPAHLRDKPAKEPPAPHAERPLAGGVRPLCLCPSALYLLPISLSIESR